MKKILLLALLMFAGCTIYELPPVFPHDYRSAVDIRCAQIGVIYFEHPTYGRVRQAPARLSLDILKQTCYPAYMYRTWTYRNSPIGYRWFLIRNQDFTKSYLPETRRRRGEILGKAKYRSRRSVRERRPEESSRGRAIGTRSIRKNPRGKARNEG